MPASVVQPKRALRQPKRIRRDPRHSIAADEQLEGDADSSEGAYHAHVHERLPALARLEAAFVEDSMVGVSSPSVPAQAICRHTSGLSFCQCLQPWSLITSPKGIVATLKPSVEGPSSEVLGTTDVLRC